MSKVFYNRIIRKMVVGFGNIFNNITLVRYNPDQTEQERLLVPIVYANKELYVHRLTEDPLLDKKVQVALPRMSFEMSGFKYDSSRKLNTNIKNFGGGSATSPTGIRSQYNPVPYDFDFNLYLYVRNIEDGTQIIEHILSYFTPDYTIKLNLVPDMGVVKEIPVILNSADQYIDYEGDRERETRIIIWTLNFTAKGFIFGPVSDVGNIITHSITSIYDTITPQDSVKFSMNPGTGVGNYKIDEFVYQGYSYSTATAMARVVSWTNNNLVLDEINGNFVSNLPIIGSSTNATYNFTSYSPVPNKQVQIDIVPDPLNANAASRYIANTTITEFIK